MKRGIVKAICSGLMVGLVMFTGCSNISDSENSAEYGSLTVNGAVSRALASGVAGTIKTTTVTITGNGITDGTLTADVVTNGGQGSVTINKIPVGNNRIITVIGKDDSGNPIDGACMRAVTKIVSGPNDTVNVDWTSSRKGYVYDALYKAGVNVRDLSDDEMSAIDSATPECDATNINTDSFVTDFKTGYANLKEPDNYILNNNDVLKRLVVAKVESSTAAAPAFTATAYFTVSKEKDVTEDAVWTSTVPSTATVSKGEVALVAAGTTVVSASYTSGSVTKTGAKQTITVTSAGGSIDKVYLSATSAWTDANVWFAAYFYTGSTSEWVKMTEVSSGLYVCNRPETEYKNIIFVRMNPSAETASWSANWGQTGDLTLPSDKDTFKISATEVTKVTEAWLSELTGTYGGGTLSATIESEIINEPSAPTVTITPASGTVSTTGSITVTYAENNAEVTAATVTVSGAASATYSLSNFTNKTLTINVSDLGITEADKTINVSASATNSEGTTNASASLTTTATVVVKDTFTWDNALMYFVIQDRFYNGNTSNDNGYNRKDNTEANSSSIGTFHGGDIAGLTQKLDYLNGLGINAIWITAPYEQAHGWTGGGDNGDFAHFAYHGYYPLDYTMMDRNMGTVEEFRTFVTECHKRGIRVVMDVVMNHTGYLTFKDMKDYSIFPFKSTWSGFNKNDDNLGYSIQYGKDDYGNDKKNFHGHHYYIDYTSGNSEWNKWWGSSWVRAGVAGSYTAGGSDDLTKCLDGLPDVKSENQTAQGLPPILNTKWNTNGEATSADYAAWRVPAADNLRQNLNVAPMVYIEKWLAAWVEEFGIDGFRCDTAKHVDHYRWGELDALCETALKSWRASSRADDYAKNWDEDFFMTGEAFGWTGGGDWFSNGFNSMIDFTCANGEGLKEYSPSLPEWSSRVGSQGLLYVSSHDTGLGRWSDQKSLGTKFVLMPGEVQIFYGDETSRSFGDTGSDKNQGTRSDFNWDAATGDCAKHWGKLGTFRKFNPAVGAGTISGDTRTYGDNKVVINTSSNSVSVPYSNGTPVYNWYDGSSTTVSNGTASFSSSVSYDSPLLVSDRNPADYGVTF